MTTTKYDITNNALSALGIDPIQTFDDESVAAQIASQQYDQTRLSLLSTYYWNFTFKSLELSRDNSTPSDPFWEYSYAIPADMIKLITCTDTYGSHVGYQQYGNKKILSNSSTLILTYSADVNETDMPYYFRDALVAELATRFAEPLTGEENLYARLKQDAAIKLQKARVADAQVNPPANNLFFNSSVLNGRRRNL